MGMDLSPRKGDHGFHANWTGWRYISSLLMQLAVEGKIDVSKLRGDNSGDYVNAKTARSWGNAVLDALEKNRIRNISFEDKYISGGLDEEPILLEPDVLTEHEIAEAILLFSLSLPAYRGLSDLSSEDKEWLEEFANFCIDSGGFYQC